MFRFLSIFSFFLLFASCAERSDVRESESQMERDSDSLAHPTNRIDSAYINQLTTEQLDSLEFRLTHHYTLNDNFIVKADSIKLVPRDDETTDTCYVKKDEMLVVVKIKRNRVSQDDDSVELSTADANLMKSMEEADKEIDASESKLTENRQVDQPTDSVPADTVWIKVAGNQYKMGWITERSLLKHTVPSDNISQLLDSLTSTRILWMGGFLMLGILGLYLHRAYNKKKLPMVKINEMDSVYPFLFIILVALLGCLYASVQNFAPEFWQEYYFHPTLNPFMLPAVMAVLVILVWLILIVFIALCMEVYNNFYFKRGVVYLMEIIGASMLAYLFISWTTQIYIGYLLFVVLAWFLWVFYDGYVKCRYQCSNCGRKIKDKGICPHCGALTE